nr:5243_t:CDS:2 [Entrophospora candida]CAG8641430.1 12046_t:CDS:2 [Entrophospora candida]
MNKLLENNENLTLEELKIAEGNISENETLDTYLAAQDDNKEDNEDDDIETSLLEEENNDINVNEGLPEPYVLIIQNTMDLSHYDFQDLDDNENRFEYLSEEENNIS